MARASYRVAAVHVAVSGNLVGAPASHLQDSARGNLTFRLLESVLGDGGASVGDQVSDSRAGGVVWKGKRTGIDVEIDRRVAPVDVTWNADGAIRLLVAIRAEEDLRASSIELRVRRGVVKSQDLRTGKVVATLKTGWKADGDLAVIDARDSVATQLLVAPLASALVVAFIPDLEPTVANSCSLSVVEIRKQVEHGVPVLLTAESTFFK